VETDEFTERLARIRQRFAASLHSKVDDSFAALSILSDKDADAIEAIIVTHRKLHEMCGIAPSIGFVATGTAARAAESVLREPAKTKRPLTAEEITALTSTLDRLRTAARSDLR
jgi:uncharacterized Fe-S center protein